MSVTEIREDLYTKWCTAIMMRAEMFDKIDTLRNEDCDSAMNVEIEARNNLTAFMQAHAHQE